MDKDGSLHYNVDASHSIWQRQRKWESVTCTAIAKAADNADAKTRWSYGLKEPWLVLLDDVRLVYAEATDLVEDDGLDDPQTDNS